MSMAERFRMGEGELVVQGSIHGLVSERDRVLSLLDAEAPAAVALGVSPKDVAALLRYERPADVDPFDDLPDHDLVFSMVLRQFGEVDLPPPDLVAAVAWAKARSLSAYGVDLAEEAYEDLFTKQVSAFGFLRYGRIQRSLSRRPPKAPDARAFALAWDAKIRKVKGIARVEAAREAHIAEASAALARKLAAKVVLVVDVSREAGVLRHASTLAG